MFNKETIQTKGKQFKAFANSWTESPQQRKKASATDKCDYIKLKLLHGKTNYQN